MADKHFLDYDGLSQFFNGLKQKFYQKPSGGIPKSDLASSVQTSLGKADNALQSHQDISGKLDKSGGTMTGAISMGASSDTRKNITMLGDPTQDYDAANKKYVDDTIGKKLVVGTLPPSDTTAIWVCTIDHEIKYYDAQSSSWIETRTGGIEAIQTDLAGKATTSYVDNAISTAVASAVVYKGTKAAVVNLPSTGNKTGDMWNVSADGMNYVWDGTKWDAQAPTFSITAITTAEINAILASTT